MFPVQYISHDLVKILHIVMLRLNDKIKRWMQVIGLWGENILRNKICNCPDDNIYNDSKSFLYQARTT